MGLVPDPLANNREKPTTLTTTMIATSPIDPMRVFLHAAKLLDEGLDAETILAELGITAHAVYTAYNRQRRPLPDEFREAHAAYKASRRGAS